MIENKEVLENVIVPLNEIESVMTTSDYYRSIDAIRKFKISDLRNILKFHKKKLHDLCDQFGTKTQKTFRKKMCNRIHDFALVGNKSVLLDRVRRFFQQDSIVTNIQRVVRGFFVRIANKIRGPALKNREMCNNDSDFCSLEPVNEIDTKDFYSYTTDKNYTYGFDINSIMVFLKKRARFENPYTRENMNHCIPMIKKLYRINQMQNPSERIHRQEQRIQHARQLENRIHTQYSRRRTNTLILPILPENYNSEEMSEKIREIRRSPVDTRIQNIFMEIDQLGNYTDSSWFSQLDRIEYIRCFRVLRDIWNYRSRLSFHVKIKICPLWDPFISTNGNYADMDYDQARNVCLTAMEDLVYMGIDTDARMLGSFQVLTSLTLVSGRARTAMPWLYESIF
jgi:hypothetical protein